MITIRPSNERGGADHGWLQSWHTFSFADYYDPEHMGFETLRVINEDYIDGGQGFGKHPHRDMEIVTVMVSGALEHQDSIGNRSVIRPGEVQRMTAGSGVFHSEYNHSPDETAHLLQIWIIPEERRLTPGYEQKSFPEGKNVLVASPDARDGSLKIHQQVEIYRVEGDFDLDLKRSAWVQLIEGDVTVNGTKIAAGDGAAVEGEPKLALRGQGKALLFHFLQG